MNNAKIEKEFLDCWNQIGVWGNSQPRCPKLEEHIHCRNCEVFSNTGREMLNRAIPDGYKDSWTKELLDKKIEINTTPDSALVFRLGDEWVSLPTQSIKEITYFSPIHIIPHRDGLLIKGLVNVRGELKICISLGSLLNLERSTKKSESDRQNIYQRLVLIANEGNEFVFPVSEIDSLHRYNAKNLQPVPTTVTKAKATYTSGILVLKDRHVACLDHELLFYTLEKSLS